MYPLRDNLRNKKTLDAFNGAFDPECLRKEIEQARLNDVDDAEISAALLIPYFHIISSDFDDAARHLLIDCDLSTDKLEDYFLAQTNRKTLFIRRSMKREMQERDEQQGGILFSTNYSNITLESKILLGRKFNAVDAMDNYIDALNLMMHRVGGLSRATIDASINEEKTLNAFLKLDTFAELRTSLKSCYDKMIWEDRCVTLEKGYPCISPTNREIIETVEIGKIVIKQTNENRLNIIHHQVLRSKIYKDVQEIMLRVRRKEKHVSSVSVKNGYVIPIINEGFSRKHFDYDLSIYLQINSYYEYAEGLVLPNANTLKIMDIALMYAELCELIGFVEELPVNWGTELSSNCLYDVPFRIQKRELADFLKQKTNYNDDEIQSFIKLITHQRDRVDFWSRPMMERGDDLLFALLPIFGSNLLYIVDEWLKVGGYSLGRRGTLFEKYVKDTISGDMKHKGYNCSVYAPRKLVPEKAKGAKWIEVDLLVEFSNCILVAEVKCITYPLESRDIFNTYSIIAEGAGQVNKVVAFLEQHKDLLRDKIPGLGSKPIVRTVITNYPLMSGHTIAGVPITDINYLRHYMSDGKIDRGAIALTADGEYDRSSTVNIKYHTNEKEFCDNLSKYLAHPLLVDFLREGCRWEKVQVSPDLFFEHVKMSLNHYLKQQ